MSEELRLAQAEHECETCGGIGTIDETLGGISTSNPEAECPDCDGKGFWMKSQKSICQDMHITPSDLEAINKMEIEAKQYCSSCGIFLGRERIAAGLSQCQACENHVKKALETGKQLSEAGKSLDGANQTVYRRLTSHLVEVK